MISTLIETFFEASFHTRGRGADTLRDLSRRSKSTSRFDGGWCFCGPYRFGKEKPAAPLLPRANIPFNQNVSVLGDFILVKAIPDFRLESSCA